MTTIIVRRHKPLSKTRKAKLTKFTTDHKAVFTEGVLYYLRSGASFELSLLTESDGTRCAIISGLVDCGFEVEQYCYFCNIVFAHDDPAPCLTPAESVGCFFNRPIPKPKLINAKPLTEAQIYAVQTLIDAGKISALDYASGGTTWAREARLLIAGGKCKPPRTKNGKADYGVWGQ
jgi:hypothetical protein